MGDITDSIRGFLEEYGMPIFLGGQAASVAMKAAANRKARQQVNDLTNAELERQAALQNESRQQFQSVMPRFAPDAFEARRQAEQDRLQRVIAPSATASGVTQNYQQAIADRPQVVGDTLAARVGDALSRGQQQAVSSAIARSFGAANTADNVAVARAGQNIGRIGRDAEASASLLPLELAQSNMRAQRSGMNTLADAFGTAADLAGNVSLRRRPRPATMP